MLVHGFAAGDMAACTLIPIPNGKNNSGTDSVNYRRIALIFFDVWKGICSHIFEQVQ